MNKITYNPLQNELSEPDINPGDLIDINRIMNKDGVIIHHVLTGTEPQTSGNYKTFFINPYGLSFEIISASVVYGAAAGGACTLDIEKLTGTTAAGSGVSILAGTFDLNTTINSVQTKKQNDLTQTKTNRIINSGDRLALKLTGTPTSVIDLVVSIYVRRRGKGHYN